MQIKTIDWSYYKGEVPGYGDCRAVPGEYACLLPDKHVESFLGIAALPAGENINYLRIPRAKGDGRMAGGGQDGAVKDHVLEWQWPAGWVKVGLMYGPDGVIYGPTDVVTPIVSREQYQDTGGWRYVSAAGALVDCKSTHHDVARGLYEWTEWPDLAIGQGAKPDMGAVVLFAGEPLRRLDPRPDGQRSYPFNARFLHSDRRGDQFGVCIVDLGARKTYFVWPTIAELRALPFVTDAPPVIPPIAPPTQPPIPPVEPPVSDYPPQLSDRLDVVLAVNLDYPGLIKSDPHRFCDQCAWRLRKIDGVTNWGRKRKNDGSFNDDTVTWLYGPTPDGKHISDIIGGDARFPTWDVRPRSEETGNGTWAPPQTPDMDVAEPPVEPPIEPPPTGDLEQRVRALEAWRAEIRRVS